MIVSPSRVLTDELWAQLEAETPALDHSAYVSTAKYKLAQIPIGAKIIDTTIALTLDQAKTLKAHGVEGVFQYLGAISSLDNIVNAGLGALLVTFCRPMGWVPSQALGVKDGNADLARMRALAAPIGSRAWIDLEGCHGPALPTSMWADARAKVAVVAGNRAGLYVGYAPGGLDAGGLWGIDNIDRYWQSCSIAIPEPLHCGWCMKQHYKPNQYIAGICVDFNTACWDFLNRSAEWIVAA